MNVDEFVKGLEAETLINISEIKIKCIELALETTRYGIYTPSEILDKAKELFDWVTDNEAFKKQD